LDQRLTDNLKFVCFVLIALMLFLIVFLFPFTVRTYKFDLLTTSISILGVVTLICSVKLLSSQKVFLP